MQKTLKANSISSLFPCQKILIDKLLKSGYPTSVNLPDGAIPAPDFLIRAPTGSGKTLAFVLPILHMIAAQKTRRRVITCITVLPTRALAKQVSSVFESYGQDLDIRTVLLSSSNTNKSSLTHPTLGISKFDVIVTTPGYLVEILEFSRLDYLRWLVIDEADQVLW